MEGRALVSHLGAPLEVLFPPAPLTAVPHAGPFRFHYGGWGGEKKMSTHVGFAIQHGSRGERGGNPQPPEPRAGGGHGVGARRWPRWVEERIRGSFLFFFGGIWGRGKHCSLVLLVLTV